VKSQQSAVEIPSLPELGPLRAPTFVDHVVEAIVSRAALGKILPGSRINELGLAKELGISRAPIREGLRMLVALGVVENTPYQGMRLAPLTPERVRQINEVRLELEKLSLREVADLKSNDALRTALEHLIEDMKTAARKEDRLALATLDADFHETLMRAAKNPMLLRFWQMMRPQLIVIFGLATLKKPLRKIAEEHRSLLNGLCSLGADRVAALMEEHILGDNLSIDFSSVAAPEPTKRRVNAKRGSA
jgi:DNA-binding GntR family transcriptional regulator